VLPFLNKLGSSYNQECKNTVYKLLNAGYIDTAEALVDSMPKIQAGVAGGLGGNHFGTFYVKHLVKIGLVSWKYFILYFD